MLEKENRRIWTRIVLVLLSIALLLGALHFMAGGGNAEAKNIVKGDTTANIKLVQQRLYNLGYYTYTIDGIWGSRTRTAVKKFQSDYGLVADGIVGAKTEKALGITLSGGGGSVSSSLSSSELNLLARCVYSEARGEPYTGQVGRSRGRTEPRSFIVVSQYDSGRNLSAGRVYGGKRRAN